MKKLIIPVLILVCWGGHLTLFAQNANPDPLVRQADSLFFNKEYRKALSFYSDYLKANVAIPISTQLRLGFCRQYTADYNGAFTVYAGLHIPSLSPVQKMQLYSRMAMLSSHNNNLDEATRFMDSAATYGFVNLWELENLPDFNNLRASKEYKNIYQKILINAYPCSQRPQARHFDFWIGEWEVYNNQYPNHKVGISLIENGPGGCSILENYTAFENAFSGKSQNWYDPNTGKWTQLWIGSGGGFQTYTDGVYTEGAMRFVYQRPGPNGISTSGNFVFENLGPDKVRQYQNVTTDDGKTYSMVYDFVYFRKKK